MLGSGVLENGQMAMWTQHRPHERTGGCTATTTVVGRLQDCRSPRTSMYFCYVGSCRMLVLDFVTLSARLVAVFSNALVGEWQRYMHSSA